MAAAEYQTPYTEPPPSTHLHLVRRLVEGILAGDSGDHLMTIHPLGTESEAKKAFTTDLLTGQGAPIHYFFPLVRQPMAMIGCWCWR